MIRNLVIKGLLVALLGVALSAIAALIAPESSLGFDFTGTSALLGLACLLFLPMTRRWEQGRWSPFLRVYLLFVPTVVGIGLFGIWGGHVLGFQTGMTAWRLTVVVVGWFAVAAWPLRLLSSDRLRTAARTALTCVTAAFLYWGLVLFSFVPDSSDGERVVVLLAAAPVLGAMSLGLPPGASVWRWARWIGWVAGLGSLAILLVELPWSWDDRMDPMLRSLATGLAAAAITIGTGVALESAMGPPWRVWVHRITVALLTLEGALATFVASWEVPLGEREVLIFLSMSLLVLVGLAGSVVLDAAGRAAERGRTAVAALTDVRLSCPRCGRSQVLPLSVAGRCDRCGLGIEVTVRQDACLRCGYSRMGLAPEVACPECGAGAGPAVSVDPTG